ncbi:hypothetical protein CBR_g44382 [Chara braunii]|uniref:Integrase zinc-binding domain-containing protein n=1 Tax=Chara braunii TaxID=69332 RepID=A0A388LX81_CHABU|nr:hypothetical protein CBR_g44382 [Chara braunii]|eukprot:GBG86928.1 hypothetical protein CBR_g44382 [Chara braunii]
MEEEMAREKERLIKEEEEKLKEVDEEEEGTPLQRSGQHSGRSSDEMEKKISEWVANLSLGEEEEVAMYIPKDEQEAAMKKWEAKEDVLTRQAMEDEQRMAWKLAVMREKKRRAKMTPKLTRWAAEIDQYDFELKPVKGKCNVVADALSRRADYFGAIVHYLDIGKDLQQQVREAYAQDPIYGELLKKVKEAPETEPNYRTTEGLPFEKTNVFDRLCIPNSEEIRSLILGECHDTEGHFGWQKTLANLMRAYTWPGMKNDCVEYVRSCKVCQRNKSSTRAPLGLLRPLPIPDQPGDSVSIDFMDTQVKSRHDKS